MYIGVDLGGTGVRVTKVDETGAILQIVREPIEIGKGMEQVAGKITSMIEHIEGYEAVAGIGMGVPGPVDTENGKIILATNLPGFEGYPIASRIEEHFHVPTFLDNDMNVSGMGEVLQGARKGKDTAYYVATSTGISGVLVVGQKVITGRNGHAGEIANLIIGRNCEKVNYLDVGAIEDEASGTTITRKGKTAFDEDAVQYAGDVFNLARKGNAKILEICDIAAYDLAVMFSQIAHIMDPEIFVIGGDVMRGKNVFFDKMENYSRNMIHKGMQTVVFTEAELDEPGVIGAVMLPMVYVKE